MQECALIFVRCRNYYRGAVDNAGWFMKLYQHAVARAFISYAHRDTRFVADAIELLPVDSIGYENLGPLLLTIKEAPSELRHVVTMLLSAPREILSYIFYRKDDQAMINKRLCEYCDLDAQRDMLTEIRQLLEE